MAECLVPEAQEFTNDYYAEKHKKKEQVFWHAALAVAMFAVMITLATNRTSSNVIYFPVFVILYLVFMMIIFGACLARIRTNRRRVLEAMTVSRPELDDLED